MSGKPKSDSTIVMFLATKSSDILQSEQGDILPLESSIEQLAANDKTKPD